MRRQTSSLPSRTRRATCCYRGSVTRRSRSWIILSTLALAPGLFATAGSVRGQAPAAEGPIRVSALRPGDELRFSMREIGCFHDRRASVRLIGGPPISAAHRDATVPLDEDTLRTVDAALDTLRQPSDRACTTVISWTLRWRGADGTRRRERLVDATCGERGRRASQTIAALGARARRAARSGERTPRE